VASPCVLQLFLDFGQDSFGDFFQLNQKFAVNVAALVTLGSLDLIFAQCQETGLIGRVWEQFKNFMFSKILIFFVFFFFGLFNF
jgi:hypothetical protein